MANFRTHVATSSLLGVGYAAAGFWGLGLPPASCALAGGLCGLSGMLPDLDSNNSVPIREVFAFSAAMIPMLMLDRFAAMGLANEEIVLAGVGVYLAIRFVLGMLLKKCTVHRGMLHSLPAAIIAGLAAFLICDGMEFYLRVFKSGAVFLGYISHLGLDEIYSFERTIVGWRRKKSFGTALKLYSSSGGGNSAAYGILLLLIVLTAGDTTKSAGNNVNAETVPAAVATETDERSLR